ncbi:MAG: hypothetical protein IJF84_08740 [Thermoguttaceae bacterium]|nr:hypothetical protein [Thermoguttaceae bacterium]
MSFTAFSFISPMPLATLFDLFKWYDKLFSPQVSIACTLIVCLVVIWVTGALFDNWFKTKKLLLAIIKTAIIGVILFSVLKATGKGDGDDGKTPPPPPPPPRPVAPAPVKRDPVDIAITYSNNGVTIDYKGAVATLPNPTSQKIFNELKKNLEDNQCFGTITIKLEKDIKDLESVNGNIDRLKELLDQDNEAQNNATKIHYNDSDANISTGVKK